MQTIALLTDFGLSDNFVGVMKGVIARINPQARCVDITHQIHPQDVFQAAFILKGSYRYFPKGTIFLVVVDPGVGTKRHPLIVRSKNYLFVGPDNGCLSLAACADGIEEIVLIENQRYLLKPISCTFQGRDIFAPCAAYLSKGKRLSTFGKSLNKIEMIHIPRPKIGKDILQGKFIYIDKFGNLVSNIEKTLFVHFRQNRRFSIRVRNTEIDFIANSYQEVPPGKPLAIFGSFDLLEISVNQGSARRYFRARQGLQVVVHLF